MEFKTMSKEQSIKNAEIELARVKRIAEKGGYKDVTTSNDMINLATKELAYTKGEIAFSEYWQAHLKVYRKKVM